MKLFCNVIKQDLKINFLSTIDYTIFSGSSIDKDKQFQNGFKIQKIIFSVNFKDKDFLYNIGFKMLNNTCICLDKIYVSYFKNVDNIIFSIGQIESSFGLENVSNNIFLYKSMGTESLSPDVGIGFKFDKWKDKYTFNISINQLKQGDYPKLSSLKNEFLYSNKSDYWILSTRFSYRPIINILNILQVGFSFHYEINYGSYLRYKIFPEAKSRKTISVLDTNFLNINRLLKSKYRYSMEFDFFFQSGSFLGNFELHSSFIKNNIEEIFNYLAFYIQFSYILTGQKREFINKYGGFGDIFLNNFISNICEIAFRYSFFNLESGNFITTGFSCNKTLGFNLYINKNISFFINYIFSNQSPSINSGFDYIKRKLHIISTRIQFKY